MKLFRSLFGGQSRTHVGRPSQPRRQLVVESLEDRRVLSNGGLLIVPDSVAVAAGDVNGDGYADIITGAGPGAAPQVKVVDGHSGQLLQSFFAYDAAFQGGVRVAAGDVNGDGRADIITAAGPTGGPHVKVFDGRSGQLLQSFFGYDRTFLGGVNVAAGDVNGDGRAEIITGAGPGAAPQVKVFDAQRGQLLRSFFAYDSAFQGGVTVAAGDVNGDGLADIITGPATGTPQVKVFNGKSGQLLQSFFAYDSSFAGGVNVAAGDVNGDHIADIITASGTGLQEHVKVFDGHGGQLLQSFYAYGSFQGGVRVAVGDVTGDGIKDVIIAGGKGNDFAFEIKDFSFGIENPTTIGSATGGAGAGKNIFAAVDAFIWFESPGISSLAKPQGETKDDFFQKVGPAFEIKDFSFGVENPTTIGSATGGAGAGKNIFAAVDAFIWFESPGISTMARPQGETKDDVYQKVTPVFEIKDFSFGVENPTTIGSATGGGGAGKIRFNEFTITKSTDSASPIFFKNCAVGAHYYTVTIEMRSTGGDPASAASLYMQFKFATVFTTKIDWSGPGDEGPEESITFVFGKLGVQYSAPEATSLVGMAPQSHMQYQQKDVLISGYSIAAFCVQYRESNFA